MAYGDGLEHRCRRKTTVGSNPTPSAILKQIGTIKPPRNGGFFIFANGLLTLFLE